MYGYGLRVLDLEFSHYPFDLAIPIDSRVKKIYTHMVDKKHKNTQIKKYFFNLADKYNIPSLHIDSILWIDLWAKMEFDN